MGEGDQQGQTSGYKINKISPGDIKYSRGIKSIILY